MVKFARVLVVAVLASILVAASLVASAWFHVQTPLGMRVITRIVVDVLAKELKGQVTAERFALRGRRVIAYSVRVRDPQGATVITSPEVRASLRFEELVLGRVHLDRAEIRGGTLELIPNAEGDPTVIDAFQPRVEGPPGGKGPTVIVDGIRIERLSVGGEFLRQRNIRIAHLLATGRVGYDGEQATIAIHTARADVLSPYGDRVVLDALSGEIKTPDPMRIELHARARRDDDRIHAVFLMTAEGEAPAHLDLRAAIDPLSPATLVGAGIAAAESIATPLRGQLRLSGPTTDLAVEAALTSNAGPLHLRGRLRPDTDVEIRTTTRGIDLARLVTSAPAIHLAGEASVHVDFARPRTILFRGAVQNFAIQEIAIPALEADGAIDLDARRVRLDGVRAPHLGGLLEIRGEAGFDGDFALRVRADIPDVADDPNVRRRAQGLRGGIRADLSVSRRADEAGISGKGEVTIRRLRAGVLRVDAATLNASARGTRTTTRGSARLRGHGVAVGDYALGDVAVDVQGTPSAFGIRGEFAAGQARRVRIEGTLAERAGGWSAELPTVELTAAGTTWRGSLARFVYWPSRAIDLGKFVLASGSQRLEAVGVYRLRGPEALEITLQDFDLAGLGALADQAVPLDVRGHADAHVVVVGDLDADPQITIDGLLREARVGTVGPIEGVAAITLAHRNAELDVQLDGGSRGLVAARGTVSLGPRARDLVGALRSASADISIEADGADLAIVDEIFEQETLPFAGRLTGLVRMRGPLVRPAIDVEILKVSPLLVPRWEPMDVVLSGHFADSVIVIDGHLDNGAQQIASAQLTATIDAEGLATGRTSAADFVRGARWKLQVKAIDQRLSVLPAPLRIDVPLRVSMQLDVERAAGRTDGNVEVDLAWEDALGDDDCAASARPSSHISIQVRNDRTQANARVWIAADEPLLQAQVQAPTSVDRWIDDLALPNQMPPVEASVHLSRAPLDRLPWVCAYASGEIDARLTARDLFTNHPQAHLATTAPALRVRRAEPITLLVDADATARRLVVEAHMSGQSGTAGIQATTETEWPETRPFPTVPSHARFLLLHEFQTAHLAPLLAALPGITDADVVATGRFQAEGTRDELQWSGHVQLADGHFELTGPGQRFDGVQGTLDFHENAAEIHELRARDLDGAIRVDGDIRFQGLFPRDATLQLEASQFPVRREGVSLANITGRADLATRFEYEPGAERHPGAQTTATLHSLLIDLPRDSLGSLQSLSPHPDVQILGEEEVVAEGRSYPFVFHIDGRDPFTVRRSDFSSQLTAELDVTYDDPDLLVAGYVNFVRGNFEIYGRRFDVVRGSLGFDGAPELNPAVDLNAAHTLAGSGAKINVAVTGHLSDIHVEFSSTDPNLSDRSRIIEALVTGSSRQQSSDATRQEGQPEAQTANFIAGIAGGVLTGIARDTLGGLVPVLAIDTGGGQGFENARFRAGFRADDFIRDNLPFLTSVLRGAYVEGFVSTPTGAGGPSGGVAGTTRAGFLIELAFPEHFVGSMTYSQPSNVGLDLLWEP